MLREKLTYRVVILFTILYCWIW